MSNLRWRLDAYVIASAVTVLWAAGVVAQDTWVGDFQLHLATVRTLAEDFVHPSDPMVGVGEGSPYYSPYMLLLAVITRATGAAPQAVLGVFAVLNVIVLLVAFWRFVARFSASAVAAVIALAALLFLWGPGSPGWSGFLDIRSFAETLPYPSTLAFALMLLLWERLLRYGGSRSAAPSPAADAPGVGVPVAIGTLAAAILLIHPFTAVETAIGAVAIGVWLVGRLTVRQWLGLAGAFVGALAVVALWPYSSLPDLAAGASALVDIHRPLRAALLNSGSLMCIYGIVALPALALRLRRDRRDPLVLMFLLAATVVVAALVTKQHQYLRMVPVMMLPLQVAFGVFVGDREYTLDGISRRVLSWARLGSVAAAVVLFAAGLTISIAPVLGAASAVPLALLPGSIADDLRTLPGAGAEYADRVRPHAPAGSTVLTDSQWTDRRLNLIGYYSVNPGWPNPWLRDSDARVAARRALLDPAASPAQRGDIARRYGAECVLLTRSPWITSDGAVAGFRLVDKWSDGELYCR